MGATEACATVHGLGSRRTQATQNVPQAPAAAAVSTGKVRPAPGPPSDQHAIDALLPDQPVDVALPPQPLPQLINTVFGDILKVPYVIGPDVAVRTDVLALRSVKGMSKRSFFRLMQLALKGYGLRADINGGIVDVVTDNAGSAPPPFVLKARAPPPPPAGERPASQLFEAKVIQVDALVGLMDDMFPHSHNVSITADAGSNSLVVTGPPRDVDAAMAALRQLDAPRFSGAGVIGAQPVYWSAESLAERLTSSLGGEGYNSAGAPGAPRSVLVLPMSGENEVLVFAKDPAALQRARYWLGQLDQPDAFGGVQTTFIYQVQNTDAQALAKLISDDENQSLPNRVVQPQAGAPGAPPAIGTTGSDRQSSSFRGGRVTVDPSGNRILFTGTAEAFGQL
ncbi:MAG TPA: secretin N-terminal domain-containing protein, partial [Caulobacteraceae bacterium]